MNDEPSRHRKYFVLALLAVFISILGIALPEQEVNGGNWNISSNFTNLYPSEREIGVTYWNNQSKPIVLDFNYFNGTAMVSNYSLYVNDTIVQRAVHLFNFGGGIYYFIPAGSYYKITNISSGTTENIYWYEHDLVFTPSIVNNYITSGGGGVSFDGNPVNLNGSNMFNGTISNYSTLAYVNDTFLPLAGGTMTGNLSSWYIFITNPLMKMITSTTPLNIYTNNSNAPMYSISEYRVNAKWFQDLYVNTNTSFTGGGMTVRVAGGNSTSPSNLPATSNYIFQFATQGYINGAFRNAWSLNGVFNPDNSTETYINLKNSSQTSATAKIMFLPDGEIQSTNYSGSGNAFPVRVDANGKLEVNRTAGAGITMNSPNGNSWCVSVSNAGAMAVAAGACP